MASGPDRFLRLFGVLWGGLVGALVLGLPLALNRAFDPPSTTKSLPLPHHIAKYPGGVSLRFAMAHDVIHERFPRHGPAYYQERNRVVRAALEEMNREGKRSPRYWELTDDLAVGLDLLGRHEEAVALMRGKLDQQKKLGLHGRDLYSSYANLGTFLILWQIQEGFAERERARQRVAESIAWIRQAVEVKPDAHFGREMWQTVLEQFLLAVLDDPQLLLEYDMVGNRLDRDVDPAKRRSFASSRWSQGSAREAEEFLRRSEQEDPRARTSYRENIAAVGAEGSWIDAVRTDHDQPVPFDEPALGIIGMWRYGGGANPHFALALAEIMLRVGQRYIAWTAYERAALLAQGIGPAPIPEGLVEHCRSRQRTIEAGLPADEIARLRPRFEQELAFGRAYQQAYQDYEARQIQRGASIDDPHFYDAFEKERGSIASAVGKEDQFVVEDKEPRLARSTLPIMLVSSGLFAFLCACLLRVKDRLWPARPQAA